MRWKHIFEDQPRRQHDMSVVEWIEKAKSRPDADQLYIHGSRKVFDSFHDPDLSLGKLIFASKLTKEPHPRGKEPYQAEYYGLHLYLVKIHYHNMFRPYSDPKAKELFKQAISGDYDVLWKEGPAYDWEQMLEWGRLDYQYLYRVVPMAVAAGYDMFRVYEVSIQSESYGAIRADMVEIVDRI